MKSFHGKVAAITGAGSGIGRALALRLAREGCHLSLADVNSAGLEETCELLQQYVVNVYSDLLDVSKREAVEEWAAKVVSDHGQVNLLFNNAGVALASTVEAMSYEDLAWLLNINLWGVIYGTKSFLPHLKAGKDGHIINISSVFGLSAQPTQSAYNISKFGVRGFTESLRQELDLEACGVSATCVHPGGINTNIARAGRTDKSVSLLTGNSESDGLGGLEKALTTPPDRAAEVIISAVRKNRRRVLIGRDAVLLDIVVRLLPAFYQRLLTIYLRRQARAAT